MINGEQRIKQKLHTLEQNKSKAFLSVHLPFSFWPLFYTNGHTFTIHTSYEPLWPEILAKVRVIRQLSVVFLF